MKITKAIIPAAGLGTRVLPASKACPKEMLPIVDKPAIQYIVEEAVKAGITDILIITNRGKGIIEDHFDHSIELENALRRSGKTEKLECIEATANIGNIYYIRQKETKGLGDAVLRARNFVGDEPFAVLYGDDVIVGDVPAIGELAEAYEAHGKSVVGIKEVTDEQVVKYCSLKVDALGDKTFSVSDMIEKPQLSQKFSNYAILGRCILTPDIFDILENTPLGAGGELQLTDAMAVIARNAGMIGVDFSGTRFDMGNKFGVIRANIEVGLKHPEVAEELRNYIKELAKEL
ncbi:MAG: UTP--glucose-1-phosphate uridylyltransferase GalU [Clostridia bacterium]|nr:UTP--glucose-1-phosphate uridylyltransferase GalU [Clostridia bacterium]